MKGLLPKSAPFPAGFLGTANEARSGAGTPSAMQAAWRMWALWTKRGGSTNDHHTRRSGSLAKGKHKRENEGAGWMKH